MRGWTAERVNQLAPDAASAKAGQGLAAGRHWVSSGFDGDALFGECQGSGSKPYQVRIDLSEPAFKCSCPSRKFPCKHSIGLMLMYAADAVKAGSKPAWVEEWFAERGARAEKKKEKADAPPKPVDFEAQAKRKEKRLERVSEGLAALQLWIHDLARSGIASIPTRDFEFFDTQARRLIDAQAPGVARRVQMLAGVASSGAGWQRPFLEQLSSLHLLINGYERRETLPEPTRETVLATLGFQRSQEEMLLAPPIADRWQILAQRITIEERLRAQQTWLFGEKTRQIVLVLHFAHGTMPLDASLQPGCAFDGDVCLVPGDTLRGAVKTRGELSHLKEFTGLDSLDALLDLHATLRAANPWLEGFAIALKNMTPIAQRGGWALADAQKSALPLVGSDADLWTLAAVAGGNPIDVAGYYDGRNVRALAAMVNGEYISLARADGEAAA